MAFDITEACPADLLAMEIPADNDGHSYDLVEAQRVMEVSDHRTSGDIRMHGNVIDPGLSLVRFAYDGDKTYAQLVRRVTFLDAADQVRTDTSPVYDVDAWDANNLSQDDEFASCARACGVSPAIMAYLVLRETTATGSN